MSFTSHNLERGTVIRPLAGWLAQQLSPYLRKFSDSHLVNSFEYKERLQYFARQHSTNSVKMMSLDIVSLFSNVPVEDVLTFIDAQIQSTRIVVLVPRETFMSLFLEIVRGRYRI